MPISSIASFRARLSYDQIKRDSGFTSSVMINDYLGIAGATQILVDQINENESNIAQNTADIEVNAENIAINSIAISANTDLINFNFQYLHGALSYSPDYDDTGTSHAVGDPVSDSGNEYAANSVIPAPAGAFDPLSWNRISTPDNYAYLKMHENETVAHGSNGNIVGDNDFCTELIGGVVNLMALVVDAVDSTAEVTVSDVGPAPVGYDAVYAQQQTDLINDVKEKHNTMLSDLNNAIAQLNELIANSKTAKQMAPS